MSQQLLTPAEAAAVLAVSVNTLAYWRCRPAEGPGLPFVKLGPRCVRYTAEDINELVEKLKKAASCGQ